MNQKIIFNQLKTIYMKITEKQKNEIKEIIADKLGYDIEEVNDTDNLKENLNADSLDTVELVMEMEKHFDITIDDDQCEKIELVQDYYSIVDKLI